MPVAGAGRGLCGALWRSGTSRWRSGGRLLGPGHWIVVYTVGSRARC